ncbi:MAG TPA: uroporphyrinogen decarboxylase family protein [Chthonomonadales bacterium]|nr:uroporphyrinogen decarboxylase family protein [Chthonomonadales bacterium]
MTGRERIEAALSPEGSPETPVLIPYEDICFRDHLQEIEGVPWWWGMAPELERQADWREAALRAIGHDAMALADTAPASRRERLASLEREGMPLVRDLRSGEERPIEPEPVNGLHSAHRPERPPASALEVDRIAGAPRPPDPTTLDLAHEMLHRRPDLYPYRHVSAPLWACYWLWGFEALMEAIARDPGLVRHGCRLMLAHAVARLRSARAGGARGVWIEDCMTDMVGPRAYAELGLPALRELTAEARALGLQTILYFCGNPWPLFHHLLESGADAIALEESKKGFVVDVEEVVDRVAGRMAVFGNVDAVGVLQDGGDGALRAELERQVRAGRRIGGRFVISLGSPVTPGTPLARVRRFCEMARALW